MKKILVISDTHGRTKNLEKILPKVQPVDYLFHLGDVGRDADYIEVIAECPCVFVAGNNDFYSELPTERLPKIEDTRFFLTHGHNYYVNAHKTLLAKVAKEKGADVAVFGHTHVPFQEEVNGVLLLNPGSLSLPRQEDHYPTYMILYVSEGGKVEAELCRVESE